MPNINHLSQDFGVELECFLPEGVTSQQCAAAVNQRLAGTATIAVEGYNHQRRNHWKIVSDGSLGDYVRGIEVVSPVLSGESGIEQAGKVTQALQDFGCTVSRKCGLHVHVGVGNFPGLDLFKNLVRLYAMFEPVIDSLMPPSRRDSTNAYCRSMTSTNLTSLARANSLDAVIRSANAGENRFFKLNLTAYRRHRTVEFRQHSGTLDWEKVTHWIRVCLLMVAKGHAGFTTVAAAPAVVAPSIPSPPVAAVAPALVNRARVGSKSWIIGNMMMRAEGVTAQEAMAAVNWPSVSLTQQARICGLEFTTVRMGRTVRYFARTTAAIAMASPAPAAPISPPPAPAAAEQTYPITLNGFIAAIGAESIRAYLETRQRNLSGTIDWAA